MSNGPVSYHLEVTELACRRGGRDVFSGLSLSAAPGDLIAVRGPNGAGKSSLLRLLAGLGRPQAGTAWLRNGRETHETGGLCRYEGHKTAIKPAFTVRETLAFWRDFRGGTGALSAAADRFGLGPLMETPAAYLSEGQRRRLALARLLLAPAPLWLLDEPHAGLDRANQARLHEVVTAHRANGGIVLMATHGALDLPVDADLQMGRQGGL